MSDQPQPTSASMWATLRRRKVVQWSLGYVAVAWGLVQALGFAVDTFDWPQALTRLGAAVALCGLPIATTLAWFHGDRGEQRVSPGEVGLLAVFAVLAAVTGRQVLISSPTSVTDRGVVATHPSPAAADLTAMRRRLAVLPFANLGNDQANEAFVGGVHDTLITQIAKVPGLSVISRSSVMQFQGKQPTIHDVATSLQVGTVLEGSVQRVGDKLRIQTQVIDAATDAHLWAETYDRPATDLFAVQSEIAQAVAEQLRIRLTAGESQRLAATLTAVPQAYEHYVLGRNFAAKQDWQEAIRELTVAVTLDPGFAAAHAQLSLSRTWLTFIDPSLRESLLPLARDGAQRALEIDPTSPEGHLARAVYLYRGEPDIDRAAREFETAIAGLPSDATAHLNFGYLRRWQGRFEDAAALFIRAAELDPRGPGSNSAIMTLAMLGRRDEALRMIESARLAQPDAARFAVWPGILAQDFDCDLAAAEKVYASVPAELRDEPEYLQERWFFSLTVGDGPAALAASESLQARAGPDDDSSAWRRGLALIASGKRDDGYAAVRREVPRTVQTATSAGASEAAADAWSWVAMHYGVLGERSKVREAAARALAALPKSGAVQSRRGVVQNIALAYAQSGETDLAIDSITEVLTYPDPIKASGYWCDPLLAPLRSSSRYRELMRAHGANIDIDPHDRRTWPK